MTKQTQVINKVKYIHIIEVLKKMVERLTFLPIQPKNIFILGDMLDVIKEKLQEKYTCSNIISNPKDCKPHTIDLIFADFLLPPEKNWTLLFEEWKNLLKPNAKGMVFFSLLGRDTLKEFTHAHQFPDMHNIGDLLFQSGFKNPVMDAEFLTIEYSNRDQMIAELTEQRFNLTSVKTPQPSNDIRKITDIVTDEVTYEIIYGFAFAPADKIISIPLNQIRRNY